MQTLLFADLGEMDYLDAVEVQQRLVAEKQRRQLPDILLLVEHPHVFTTGRAGREEHLLARDNVSFYRTNRGGDITYHGPGQLVVYPLLDLRSKLRRDVHLYLRRLERTAILTLKQFDIAAARKPPWTGIWIDGRKIASIGVAVRRGITYHGLALNISTDLSYFRRIVPCGLHWADVTSIERELGREVRLDAVKRVFVETFMARFGYAELKELCPEDIQTGSKLKPLALPTTCV